MIDFRKVQAYLDYVDELRCAGVFREPKYRLDPPLGGAPRLPDAQVARVRQSVTSRRAG